MAACLAAPQSKWVLCKAGSERAGRASRPRSTISPSRPATASSSSTAGSGGWGDPLERPSGKVARDVQYDLVSREQAETGYGVILTAEAEVDVAATEALRVAMRAERGDPAPFNFGFDPSAIKEAAE